MGCHKHILTNTLPLYNGWELNCGDENFTDVHCYSPLSFEKAQLVKIHRPEVPSLLATG
jgi:hypothetical protein